MNKLFIICLIFLSGCEMAVDAKPKNPDQVNICTDFRDGEKFTIIAKNMRHVRLSLDDTCFDLKDEGGIDRHLCKSMESYLKCEKVK